MYALYYVYWHNDKGALRRHQVETKQEAIREAKRLSRKYGYAEVNIYKGHDMSGIAGIEYEYDSSIEYVDGEIM